MGQEPMRAGSPSGYGDTAHAWDGAEALMTRIDWASFLASYVKAILPSEFLLAALGGQVSKNTQNSIENAESRRQGLVLALMSPEFQRR